MITIETVFVTMGILGFFLGIVAVGFISEHRQWKREMDALKKKAGGPQ